jgi:tetratricopeptide (TPR) repeat protein
VLAERKLLALVDLGTLAGGMRAERELELDQSAESQTALDFKVDYRVGDEVRTATSRLLTGATTFDPSEAGMSDEYRALVTPAKNYYNEGNWAEAQRLFLKAWERWPNARLARALGMAEQDLRHPDQAARYFVQALESKVRPLSPAQRRDVEQRLERLGAPAVP